MAFNFLKLSLALPLSRQDPKRQPTLQRQIVQLERSRKIGKNRPRVNGDSKPPERTGGTRQDNPRLANGFQERPTFRNELRLNDCAPRKEAPSSGTS
jgi:hypothetical protein